MGRALISVLILVFSLIPAFREARADNDHQLVRRLVVFPMTVPKGYENAGEEAWWQARDEFTRSRRFLVASKQFLIKSDVFQPRGELSPADAIILGKLLDAHALVTFILKDRELMMSVYDGGNGATLYQKTVGLHPSLTVDDQLGSLTRRVVNDFIAAIPYQGFTIIDPLIGTPVYNEGSMRLARIDLGAMSEARTGDTVHWIRMSAIGAEPLFQGGGKITVIAEGKIIKIENGIATAEVMRATSLKSIKEHTLVRLPREAERLRATYALTDTPPITLGPELVAPEAAPMKEVVRERQPLVATLSWVGSMAVFLLLAF